MSDMDEVAVATFQGEAEAAAWSDLLRSVGIPNVLVPLGPGAGGWGNSSMLPHQLRVRWRDVPRALALLPRPEDTPH